MLPTLPFFGVVTFVAAHTSHCELVNVFGKGGQCWNSVTSRGSSSRELGESHTMDSDQKGNDLTVFNLLRRAARDRLKSDSSEDIESFCWR